MFVTEIWLNIKIIVLFLIIPTRKVLTILMHTNFKDPEHLDIQKHLLLAMPI